MSDLKEMLTDSFRALSNVARDLISGSSVSEIIDRHDCFDNYDHGSCLVKTIVVQK